MFNNNNQITRQCRSFRSLKKEWMGVGVKVGAGVGGGWGGGGERIKPILVLVRHMHT